MKSLFYSTAFVCGISCCASIVSPALADVATTYTYQDVSWEPNVPGGNSSYNAIVTVQYDVDNSANPTSASTKMDSWISQGSYALRGAYDPQTTSAYTSQPYKTVMPPRAVQYGSTYRFRASLYNSVSVPSPRGGYTSSYNLMSEHIVDKAAPSIPWTWY